LGHLHRWKILEWIWTIGGENAAQNSISGFCEHDSASSNIVKPESTLTVRCSIKTQYQIQVVWDLGAYIFRGHLLIEDWCILRYDIMYLGRKFPVFWWNLLPETSR
jgi:hypothetical protein